MGVVFPRKPSMSNRHHNHNHRHRYWKWNKWKKSLLLRLLFFCFLLGFFVGLSPFAHLHLHLDDDDFADADSSSVSHLKPHNPLPSDPIPTASANPGNRGNPQTNLNSSSSSSSSVAPPISSSSSKLVIVVTPTYNRALQAYYLTRLAQTLRLVPPPLLWIVVEMNSLSTETSDLLRGTGVNYRHLVCNKSSADSKDRGVHQRNTALDHIRRHLLDGIVYFADDDNIYSLQLFHHLRNIRRFGTWPVAMLAQSKSKATLEGPICNGSQVIGWHTNEKSKRLRRFHVDMSGFAFSSTILWDPKRWHRPTLDAIKQLDTVKEGFQETTFIEQVVEDESQMEGVPHCCSKIMNWHLHLEARHLFYPKGWQVAHNLDVVRSLR